MTWKEEVVEIMAEHAHNAWWDAYKQLGYTSRKAEWGEEFMVPYAELSERGKEFDRIIMRGILRGFRLNNLMVTRGFDG